MDDHALAAEIAEQSGRALMRLRADAGPDTGSLGATGDRRSHELIVRRLGEARPDDELLSEEAAENPRRLGARRVWIVDPLDGTREYSEGRSDFAVHVALVEDGRPSAGAVALPASGAVFATTPTPPRRPTLPARSPGPWRILVSRTRPPAEAERVAARLGAELISMGSAGAKSMAVVQGEADAYVHAGGQYEWDSAAPVVVAWWAGAHASRLDGSRLVYNQRSPWLPDLLVCRPEVTESIFEALRP